uniref:Uncharacterized protein n=1 Tax=Timema genevievae TaxID=629358 RepID=A0A7R9PQT9_TIMGE|nr:unnamed protein product [Timema genevievae]
MRVEHHISMRLAVFSLAKATDCNKEDDSLDWATTDMTISGVHAEVEGGAAGVIAAVVIGVLVTIVLLFSMALLIDCRNKKKAIQAKQNKSQRRAIPKRTVLSHFAMKREENGDNISFANKMCLASTTSPPAVLKLVNEIC